jgi:hypothetical protein
MVGASEEAVTFYHLIYGGTRFVLPVEVDIVALKQAVLDAVLEGGRLVRFETYRRERTEILVSPGVDLRFDEIEPVEEAGSSDAEWPDTWEDYLLGPRF